MANIKMKCVGCAKELTYFHMVLTMGPKGYRRYAMCDRCAMKAEKNLSPRPSLKGKGAMRSKAGV